MSTSTPTRISAESFLGLLGQSRLIDPEPLRKALKELKDAGVDVTDPKVLADQLIARNILTRWQAEKLLQGKHKGFFLGKYRLLSLLGTGGMSSVYLAEHVLMRRRVAIKILPQQRVDDSSYLKRFHREAQAVAALDHRNIVRAYDVDVDGKNHFLVMEFVPGKNLQELVAQQGNLGFVQAAEYMRQAAEGLAHAHKAGLVHRDIKPGNLLIDEKGTIKLLDLGLARFFDEGDESSLTLRHDEKVLGTADYLSPEQARDSHNVDVRSDIYSLGCTLYFTLTGHPPFAEGTMAMRLLAHQQKQPDPVSKDRPDVPESLAAIVDKMMAKDVSARYQTARETSLALQEWLTQNGGGEWAAMNPQLGGASAILTSSAAARLDSKVPPPSDSASRMPVVPGNNSNVLGASGITTDSPIVPAAPPDVSAFFANLTAESAAPPKPAAKPKSAVKTAPVAEPAAPSKPLSGARLNPAAKPASAVKPASSKPLSDIKPVDVRPAEQPKAESPKVEPKPVTAPPKPPVPRPAAPEPDVAAMFANLGGEPAAAAPQITPFLPALEEQPPAIEPAAARAVTGAAPPAPMAEAAPADVTSPVADVEEVAAPPAPADTAPVTAAPAVAAPQPVALPVVPAPPAVPVVAAPVVAAPVIAPPVIATAVAPSPVNPSPVAAPTVAAPVVTAPKVAPPVVAAPVAKPAVVVATAPVVDEVPPLFAQPAADAGGLPDFGAFNEPIAPRRAAPAAKTVARPSAPPTAAVAVPVVAAPVAAAPVVAAPVATAVPVEPSPSVAPLHKASNPLDKFKGQPMILAGIGVAVVIVAGLAYMAFSSGGTAPPKEGTARTAEEKPKPGPKPRQKPQREDVGPFAKTLETYEVGPGKQYSTIAAAIQRAKEYYNTGYYARTVLKVAPGTYAERIELDKNNPAGLEIVSASSSEPVVLSPTGSDPIVVLKDEYRNFKLENVVLEAKDRKVAVRLLGEIENAQFINVRFSGFTTAGVLCEGAFPLNKPNVLSSCTFQGGPAATGVRFEAADGYDSARLVVDGSTFLGPMASGLDFSSAVEVKIAHTIFANLPMGIRFQGKDKTWSKVTFAHNTFFNCERGIVFEEMPGPGTNELGFYNNLFLKTKGSPVSVKDLKYENFNPMYSKVGSGVSDNWMDAPNPMPRPADFVPLFEIGNGHADAKDLQFHSLDPASPDFLVPLANSPLNNQRDLSGNGPYVGARRPK